MIVAFVKPNFISPAISKLENSSIQGYPNNAFAFKRREISRILALSMNSVAFNNTDDILHLQKYLKIPAYLPQYAFILVKGVAQIQYDNYVKNEKKIKYNNFCLALILLKKGWRLLLTLACIPYNQVAACAVY